MMNHARITTLDGINIAAFLASSIPRMDAGTFEWPADCKTFDDKAAFLHGRIDELLAHPSSFCHKVTLFGDPVHLIFSYTVGTVLHRVIALFKPDKSGSLAHVYNPNLIADRDAFFREHGITEIAGMTTVNSPIQKIIEAHNGPQTFTEESVLHGGAAHHTFRQTIG